MDRSIWVGVWGYSCVGCGVKRSELCEWTPLPGPRRWAADRSIENPAPPTRTHARTCAHAHTHTHAHPHARRPERIPSSYTGACQHITKRKKVLDNRMRPCYYVSDDTDRRLDTMFLLEWFLEEWRKKSTFEKILDAIGYTLFISYTIILPALVFITLWLEG